jgi:hypothetical protein
MIANRPLGQLNAAGRPYAATIKDERHAVCGRHCACSSAKMVNDQYFDAPKYNILTEYFAGKDSSVQEKLQGVKQPISQQNLEDRRC